MTEMKLLCVHAHPDDFEFTSLGLFLQAGQREPCRQKIIICTDGAAGHHRRSRAETARLRFSEQARAAREGNFEFEFLQYPDGTAPREGCLVADRFLLAALWKAIRDFEPDYLFCPPYPADPLAGVHPDHWVVAEAVRKVAYTLNVPHAFSPEFSLPEEEEPVFHTTPVILNVYDAYMSGANHYDLLVDLEPVFETFCRVTWCHQSQIAEWLPWVARHSLPQPKKADQWPQILRAYLERRNAELGLADKPLMEAFKVTNWGAVPSLSQLRSDFPFLSEATAWERLQSRFPAS